MADGDQLFARFGKAVPAGTVLFREDERGDTMYVVQSGSVRITKAGGEGAKTLAVLGPGEFFGEMAILNNKPRTATAEVVKDARLLVLDARTFEQMVVSNTEIAVRLIKKMARRLDSALALVEILMHRDPKARVILGLSREAEVNGQEREDGSVFIPISLAALSENVGLHANQVTDVLKRLGRLRMVEQREAGFVVTDVMRLHEFLEFLEMQEKFGEI
jgi:CRP-like cAMP-binding protein